MKARLFPVIILAGGLATRLRPLTATLPKALVAVNGEPFIVHQLRLLRCQGVEDIVICAGYLGEQIVQVIGDGSQFGLHVRYSFDGPKLLGTAGAIKQALPLLLEESFFVLYGDSYLPCDFLAVQNAFVTSKKRALMTVFRNNGLWDKSNVEFVNDTILAYGKQHQTERMDYIDYGLGVFQKEAFNEILASEVSDLALLYQAILQQQQLAAYEVLKRFYEMGSFAGLKELEHYLSASSDVTE